MRPGNVSQWGEVKKKHGPDRSRPKAKESQQAPADTAVPSARGGRGRGGIEGRGGRARGDRGRTSRGGRAGAHVNGARAAPTTSTEAPQASTETPSDQPPAEVAPSSAWGQLEASKDTAATAEKAQKSTVITEGSKKGWASLFAKPTPPPPQKKPPPPAAPVQEEAAAEPTAVSQETAPVPTQPEATQEHAPPPAETVPAVAPVPAVPAVPELKPKEDLQKPAVEPTAPEVQAPVAQQETAAVPQQQQLPTATTGYAATPYRGVVGSNRASSFQRRVLDQQEAVVMPEKHAVDRAAVQFGSMNLNGPVDDIDDEREQAETRPQPPQHSPVAPRASLPPSTQAAQAPPETAPAQRPAPGLPPAPPTTIPEASFNEFGRYGEAPKPYDPFSQQVEQVQPQAQEPFSSQASMPSQPTATTAADYSAFYGADHARNPYYYGAYGQPQEAARASSGFGTSGADIQPQVVSTQPPRYGHVEAANSGQNTPNPTVPGQTQPAQPPQHIPQAHGAAAHGAYNYGGYPYYSTPHYPSSYMGQQHQYGRNRPMYDDARRYEEQPQQHYLPHGNQFGYGNQYAPYGKGAMYGQQPQHGFSYDQHSSSPATAASFGQTGPTREGSYGRAGSAQPSEGQQSTGGNAFGGMPDVFGRTQAGFGPNQGMSSQQPPTTAEEASKNYEVPKAGGPSPSVAHVNRPGSATNNTPNQPATGQSGLPSMPAQQGNQQAFGNYPHLNAQYSGLGGIGTHHQGGASQNLHQQGTGYGSYNAGFGGSNYYGNNQRGGGWGGNYGH